MKRKKERKKSRLVSTIPFLFSFFLLIKNNICYIYIYTRFSFFFFLLLIGGLVSKRERDLAWLASVEEKAEKERKKKSPGLFPFKRVW